MAETITQYTKTANETAKALAEATRRAEEVRQVLSGRVTDRIEEDRRSRVPVYDPKSRRRRRQYSNADDEYVFDRVSAHLSNGDLRLRPLTTERFVSVKTSTLRDPSWTHPLAVRYERQKTARAYDLDEMRDYAKQIRHYQARQEWDALVRTGGTHRVHHTPCTRC